MILYSLDIIQELIEAKPSITQLLGKYTAYDEQAQEEREYPNIAQDVVPDGMLRPYIVLREEADTMADNKLFGIALVSADIFAENDRALVKEIAGKIDVLFRDRHYADNPDGIGTGARKSFIRSSLNVPQPDPSVKCRNVKIELHYARDDLLIDD